MCNLKQKFFISFIIFDLHAIFLEKCGNDDICHIKFWNIIFIHYFIYIDYINLSTSYKISIQGDCSSDLSSYVASSWLQILNFEVNKDRNQIFLERPPTEVLLEELENSEAMLAMMLTSPHIGPLREEAATWAQKLKEISVVLEQLLDTQDMWRCLESLFSDSQVVKVQNN